jgi:hypothetical protein
MAREVSLVKCMCGREMIVPAGTKTVTCVKCNKRMDVDARRIGIYPSVKEAQAHLSSKSEIPEIKSADELLKGSTD